LKKTLAEVEKFALNEYLLALMKGNRLTAKERASVTEKLARYTGLSEEYVSRSNLRVPIFRFVKELLRDKRLTVGRFDSRFTGKDRDAAGEKFDYDPSYATIQGVYTAMLNDYIRRDLKFESDLSYQILTGRVHPWKFDKHQNVYVNVAETLRKSITRNPYLQVFIANGYYDLATPYFATHYTIDHMELDKDLQKNISMGHYEAGHMMYARESALKQLKNDLEGFISGASSK
jgi:carboxypeptidase C (cathepsin A)